MRRLLIIALFLGTTSANALEQDKVKHFMFSAAISEAATRAYQHADEPNAQWRGFQLAMMLGVLKELTDDHFDEEDLLADALGASMPIVFRLNFEF